MSETLTPAHARKLKDSIRRRLSGRRLPVQWSEEAFLLIRK